MDAQPIGELVKRFTAIRSASKLAKGAISTSSPVI
jgi:hypothetical protein